MEKVHDPDLLSLQQVRDLVARAHEAQKRWATFSQAQIDAVIEAVAEAASREAEPLARLAVEETGYGNVADKIRKNKLAAEDVHRAIRGLKTVGIIREDRENAIVEVAEPVGVVAAIIPSTNPTSTAIYKTLISLKARNAIVLSPHPTARRCICATADVLLKAALKAGAPEGLIGCMTQVTMQATQELMRHRRVALILATGGTGLVRAAYSSGKPALGVGPGNVPAYIERTAVVRKAVADIIAGKTFDNGTLCSSEQSIVCDEPIRAAVLHELREQGAYFLNAKEIDALSRIVIRPDTGVPNPKIVGRAAPVVAQVAGFQVPAATRVLVAELTGIGREHPLSLEKLSPILAFYTVKNYQEGIEVCNRLLEFGGLGHTIAIHSQSDAIIREFGQRVRAYRVMVNTPASLGSVGATTRLFPSMTLGCGAPGGNITSDNISPKHLMNVKRIAWETKPVEQPPARLSSPLASAAPLSPPPPPAPVAAAAPTSSAITQPDRATIARVVERFLSQKGVPRGESNPGHDPGPPSAQAPSPPAPAAGVSGPRPAEFVSESDVRAALARSEKIYVSPRSIVTPAARDLGNDNGVFVEVEAPLARRGN
ncbi:MAG TPA: acetaldehyde dehydrogenase (acetylating) [Candidatus Xenobia bacterium]|nr:acetaldehyde dehydrogenase (acetylating) [Candidatus Xenobia bacterium]